MGIGITEYRQAIGPFNNVRFIRCQCTVKFIILPVIMVTLVIIQMLLLRSGSIELNPGPNTTARLKNLLICHANKRGFIKFIKT